MPKALFKSKNGGKAKAAKMAVAGAVGSSDQAAFPATSLTEPGCILPKITADQPSIVSPL